MWKSTIKTWGNKRVDPGGIPGERGVIDQYKDLFKILVLIWHFPQPEKFPVLLTDLSKMLSQEHNSIKTWVLFKFFQKKN